MNSSIVVEIDKKIELLPKEQQLWLVEQIARRLREQPPISQDEEERNLAAMAADPEIKRELQKIEEEFTFTEQDGLGNI